MSDVEWQRVQDQLTEARTPQEKQEAAAALVKHIPEEHLNKHLVIMQKGGVHAVKLAKLHLAMQYGPTYDLVKKIIAGR